MLPTPLSASKTSSRHRDPICHGDENRRLTTYLKFVNPVNTNSNMDAVQKVIAEGHALTRALAVVEAGASADEARRFCSKYLEHHTADSVENVVIDCALRRICGLLQTTYNDPHIFKPSSSLEDFLLEEGAIRWVDWACGVSLPFEVALSSSLRSESALNRMALTQWIEAVVQLQRGSSTEGRRYFRRAMTLGATYGTVSNPVIQWTYAASFFPTGADAQGVGGHAG